MLDAFSPQLNCRRCLLQRVLSRQEELKERARLLLEQARRDAAMKAGSKNVPNSALNAANRSTSVCDVSVCVSMCV